MPDLPFFSDTDARLNLSAHKAYSPAAEARVAMVQVAFTELRPSPDFLAPIDTQVMYGETVQCAVVQDGWALVQADRDGYVGWLEAKTLTFTFKPVTHLVSAQRTFFYPEPDLKRPHKGMRSMGSGLHVVGQEVTRGTKYAILDTGEAVIESHIVPVGETVTDYVSVAEHLILTPYLWAGTTAFGIDCSGLVKLAMFMVGKHVLRDSDMQAATIGGAFDPGSDYSQVERGDLIFWRGHVGICQGAAEDGTQMLIHANGHTMNVASEPLIPAIDRIAYLYESPTAVRRP